jgi:hypothetical protein
VLILDGGIALMIAWEIELDFRAREQVAAEFQCQSLGDLLVEYMQGRRSWPNSWEYLEAFVLESSPTVSISRSLL